MSRLLKSIAFGLTVFVAAATVFVATSATAQTIEPPADRVTVVMTELEPFIENDNGRADGFYAEIWDVVADDLGVDYDVVWVDTFAELLPMVAAGQADVAVAPLAPTATREVGHDFTSAVISSGPQLGYHERLRPDQSILDSLFSTEIRRILLVALAGLIILAHLIWLVERNRDDEENRDFHPSYLHGIWDGLWWATVTVTTVGYGDKAPRSIRGRLVALLAMFLSLFLVGAFVSQITDVLTANREAEPVTSLDDVRDVPVGAVAGSTFAEFLIAEDIDVVGFGSQAELFEAAASGDVDVVVSNPFALSTTGTGFGLTPVGEVLFEEFETFGLAQGSPWREPINQALADLQAEGEVEEIVDRWIN